MTTIRDVAQQAGVSVATASRALNGLNNVTAALRERVEAAARELAYVPHSGARSLTMRRTNSIGVVLPDLFGEFFSELIRGIDMVAHRAGLQLLLSNMHGNAQGAAAAIRAMRGRVDGLLVMPTALEPEYFDTHPTGLPTVLLARSGATSLPSVSIDNYRGAREMTEYLCATGARRIAYISGPRDNRDAAERESGFRDGLKECLGELSPMIIPGDFTEEAGSAAARLMIAGGCVIDTVFAANDMMAVGCLAVLREAGIDVPGRIAVAGFDDIPLARHTGPSLTTMQVHIAELGMAAVDQLLRMLRGEGNSLEPILLAPALVTRESTKAILRKRPQATAKLAIQTTKTIKGR